MLGGQTGPSVMLTETWNGTSWTEVNEIFYTEELEMAGGGSNSEHLVYGGTSWSRSSKTENLEWIILD